MSNIFLIFSSSLLVSLTPTSGMFEPAPEKTLWLEASVAGPSDIPIVATELQVLEQETHPRLQDHPRFGTKFYPALNPAITAKELSPSHPSLSNLEIRVHQKASIVVVRLSGREYFFNSYNLYTRPLLNLHANTRYHFQFPSVQFLKSVPQDTVRVTLRVFVKNRLTDKQFMTLPKPMNEADLVSPSVRKAAVEAFLRSYARELPLQDPSNPQGPLAIDDNGIFVSEIEGAFLYSQHIFDGIGKAETLKYSVDSEAWMHRLWDDSGAHSVLIPSGRLPLLGGASYLVELTMTNRQGETRLSRAMIEDLLWNQFVSAEEIHWDPPLVGE